MAVFVCKSCDVAQVTLGRQPFCSSCGHPMVKFERAAAK